MWMVRLALARPYTVVVFAFAILLAGVLAIVGAPGIRPLAKDIFPEIDEPIVTLIWQYVGMPAAAYEKQVTIFSEQQISTTVSNVRRIESHTIYGKNVIRIYFQPKVRIDQAMSEITGSSQTIIRRMPPGQTAPQIVQYNASSVPILQIALGSDTLTEQELYDQGLWLVRNQVIPIPGTTVLLPYGGRPRLIMIDAEPEKMQARGVTVKDINDALNRQNVNLPTGSTQIGNREYIMGLNNSPQKIDEIGDLPIRVVGDKVITIRDVASVRDGFNEQTSLVRHDGRKSTLLTVLKNGGASTLDIVRQVRERLGGTKLPEGLKLSFLFDQSVFVTNAIHGVVVEGLIAAGLTGLLIFGFLGSWRSTVVVVTTIPLAVLLSIVLLGAAGHTLNLMTLGGLALAVGILVDDATGEPGEHPPPSRDGQAPARRDRRRREGDRAAGLRVDALHLRRVPAGAAALGRREVPVHPDGARRRVRGGVELRARTHARARDAEAPAARTSRRDARRLAREVRHGLRQLPPTLRGAARTRAAPARRAAREPRAGARRHRRRLHARRPGFLPVGRRGPDPVARERPDRHAHRGHRCAVLARRGRDPPDRRPRGSRRRDRQHRHPAVHEPRLQRQHQHHVVGRRDPGVAEAGGTARRQPTTCGGCARSCR